MLAGPQPIHDQEDDLTYTSCRVPGFVTKAFEIFSDTRHESICGWGRDGKTILIRRIADFEATVIPLYFKHSNYSSFVRQLNMYDFHKTVANPQIAEFHHSFFQRGRPDLLHLVKRKIRAGGKEEECAVPAPGNKAKHREAEAAHLKPRRSGMRSSHRPKEAEGDQDMPLASTKPPWARSISGGQQWDSLGHLDDFDLSFGDSNGSPWAQQNNSSNQAPWDLPEKAPEVKSSQAPTQIPSQIAPLVVKAGVSPGPSGDQSRVLVPTVSYPEALECKEGSRGQPQPVEERLDSLEGVCLSLVAENRQLAARLTEVQRQAAQANARIESLLSAALAPLRNKFQAQAQTQLPVGSAPPLSNSTSPLSGMGVPNNAAPCARAIPATTMIMTVDMESVAGAVNTAIAEITDEQPARACVVGDSFVGVPSLSVQQVVEAVQESTSVRFETTTMATHPSDGMTMQLQHNVNKSVSDGNLEAVLSAASRPVVSVVTASKDALGKHSRGSDELLNDVVAKRHFESVV